MVLIIDPIDPTIDPIAPGTQPKFPDRGDDLRVSEIQSITPKIFIQDDGTDYDTGEEFNGLWPGFANLGHWKLNERKGTIAFNNRNRRRRNLYLSNTRWGTDSKGNHVSYRLPRGNPLSEPLSDYFIMIGSGGGYNSFNDFDSFLKSGGNDIPPHALNYQFDVWVKSDRLMQDGETETLLYLHDIDKETNFHRVFKFCLEKISGQTYFSIYGVHEGRETWSKVSSSDAGDFFEKNVLGFNHLGFVYRLGLPDYLKFLTSEEEIVNVRGMTHPHAYTVWNPDAASEIDFQYRTLSFYVNGREFPVDLSSTIDWYKGGVSLNVSPFIGCQISADAPEFSQLRSDASQEVKFNEHFTGKIYAVQWNNSFEVANAERMSTLYNLKFDVPRGPGWVDFSDFEETRGKNLLKNLGRISQAIENKHGNFYVTLNRVTMKNS